MKHTRSVAMCVFLTLFLILSLFLLGVRVAISDVYKTNCWLLDGMSTTVVTVVGDDDVGSAEMCGVCKINMCMINKW